MKKIKLIMFTLLMTLLLGCSSSNKEVKNAFNNFKNYKNYTTDYSVNVTTTDGLQMTKMTLLGDSRVDKNSKILYDETELTSGNSKVKNRIYIEGFGKIETTKYMNNSFDNIWTKETSTKVSLDSNIIDYLDLKKEYTEIESDVEGSKAYETSFTINELSGILNAAFGNSKINYKTANAAYRIYIKDNNIVQIFFGLSAEYDSNMVSYIIKAKYSKFNETSAVTIPEEILINAKELEKKDN